MRGKKWEDVSWDKNGFDDKKNVSILINNSSTSVHSKIWFLLKVMASTFARIEQTEQTIEIHWKKKIKRFECLPTC